METIIEGLRIYDTRQNNNDNTDNATSTNQKFFLVPDRSGNGGA